MKLTKIVLASLTILSITSCTKDDFFKDAKMIPTDTTRTSFNSAVLGVSVVSDEIN